MCNFSEKKEHIYLDVFIWELCTLWQHCSGNRAALSAVGATKEHTGARCGLHMLEYDILTKVLSSLRLITDLKFTCHLATSLLWGKTKMNSIWILLKITPLILRDLTENFSFAHKWSLYFVLTNHKIIFPDCISSEVFRKTSVLVPEHVILDKSLTKNSWLFWRGGVGHSSKKVCLLDFLI